ncbi:MAG: hypothetical protein FJW78_03440 [Actinobacteria bacterium]|nr:hypothetical protein [Actinomycetota bacterium]
MVLAHQVEALRADLRLQEQIEQATYEQYEAELDALWARHDEELDSLRAEVDERDAEIEALRAEIEWLRERTNAPELRCESEQLEMFGEE